MPVFRQGLNAKLPNAPQNSSSSSAALYSSGSGAAPCTLGFGHRNSHSMIIQSAGGIDSGFRLGRLRGQQPSDVATGYAFAWGATLSVVSASIDLFGALYVLDKADSEFGTLRQIDGSLASMKLTVTGSPSRTDCLLLPEPIEIPRDQEVLVGVGISFATGDFSASVVYGTSGVGTTLTMYGIDHPGDTGAPASIVIAPANFGLVNPGIAVTTSRNRIGSYLGFELSLV